MEIGLGVVGLLGFRALGFPMNIASSASFMPTRSSSRGLAFGPKP